MKTKLLNKHGAVNWTEQQWEAWNKWCQPWEIAFTVQEGHECLVCKSFYMTKHDVLNNGCKLDACILYESDFCVECRRYLPKVMLSKIRNKHEMSIYVLTKKINKYEKQN